MGKITKQAQRILNDVTNFFMGTYRTNTLEITKAAEYIWGLAWGLYGDAVGEMPPIMFNNRLKSTAGRAFMLTAYNRANFPDLIERVELSKKLYENNQNAFLSDIIRHELGHFIAFRVFNEENHGKAWREVMNALGDENPSLLTKEVLK
jgi:hypothetical protein